MKTGLLIVIVMIGANKMFDFLTRVCNDEFNKTEGRNEMRIDRIRCGLAEAQIEMMLIRRLLKELKQKMENDECFTYAVDIKELDYLASNLEQNIYIKYIEIKEFLEEIDYDQIIENKEEMK